MNRLTGIVSKAGHPEPPHAHGPMDFWASLRMAEKSLPSPNEVAGSETEQTDREGSKSELANVSVCGVMVLETSCLIHVKTYSRARQPRARKTGNCDSRVSLPIVSELHIYLRGAKGLCIAVNALSELLSPHTPQRCQDSG